MKTIRLEEGLRGFYKGLVPRLCMQTLSGATAWASYEYIKKRLLKYSDLLWMLFFFLFVIFKFKMDILKVINTVEKSLMLL